MGLIGGHGIRPHALTAAWRHKFDDAIGVTTYTRALEALDRSA